MFLTICQPLADARGFLDQDTGKLKRPSWPLPRQGSEFIRSFGQIRTRRGTGLPDFPGMRYCCDASAALKLDEWRGATWLHARQQPSAGHGHTAGPLRPCSRFVFSDGFALSWVEISFAYSPRHPRQEETAPPQKEVMTWRDVHMIIAKAANSSVRIAVGTGPQRAAPIKSAGPQIAKAYFEATTTHEFRSKAEDWWVEPTDLFIVADCPELDPTTLPSGALHATLPGDPLTGIEICFLELSIGESRYGTWVIPRCKDSQDATLRRTLRLALLHWCSEVLVIASFARQIRLGRIPMVRFEDGFDNLQHYFNLGTRRLQHSKTRLVGAGGQSGGFLDIFNMAMPGMLSGIQQMLILHGGGIRPNIARKIAEIGGGSHGTFSQIGRLQRILEEAIPVGQVGIWIAGSEIANEVRYEIPTPPASHREIIYALVNVLDRRGLLTQDFFEYLETTSPGFQEAIMELRVSMGL